MSAIVVTLALPTAAAQAEPACGTTPEQWVGYFPGINRQDSGDEWPLDHTITLTDGVLAVDTLINGWKRMPPYGDPVLTGDSLVWTTAESGVPGGEGETSRYTTESVTCANGVVQSFTGELFWVYQVPLGPVFWVYSSFTASRS
ncbi:hypothetical protein BLA60_11575 [Actinophytocola xinjiangensis]|uniref:Uncharacterized protein n=1 Tax=Actinophytocola xinjiangensis TaxID=485602 RepID=A0A7Z1AYD8_9PSEU|nr:hypothetical protein BLA60_11575 [Actinophytocola xinjiangensis]